MTEPPNAYHEEQENDRKHRGIPDAEQSNPVERHVAPETGSIYDRLFEENPRVKECHGNGDLGDQR